MATHFTDIVTFVVQTTSSTSGIRYLDTSRGGVVAEVVGAPTFPWPTSSVQILGTTKWVRPKRWELTHFTTKGNKVTSDLCFKTLVPEAGYAEFNESSHQMDQYLRDLFKSGGSLQLNISIDTALIPLIVVLPKP